MTPGVVGNVMGGGSVSSRLSGSSRFALAGLCVVALLAPACGGGGASGPSNPSSSPPTTQPASPSAATVTITAAGVSPQQVEIPVGGRVTFTNSDTGFHEMHSNPHPIHTDCPPMNDVGPLSPGQSRQTGAFTVARTCGYHDHGQPTNPDLQGTIVIK
jgi:plastocyanin